MRGTEKPSQVSKCLQTKLAVVQVNNGESQEDAWRRYLAENPESAGVDIRIFHYPRPRPRKKEGPEG